MMMVVVVVVMMSSESGIFQRGVGSANGPVPCSAGKALCIAKWLKPERGMLSSMPPHFNVYPLPGNNITRSRTACVACAEGPVFVTDSPSLTAFKVTKKLPTDSNHVCLLFNVWKSLCSRGSGPPPHARSYSWPRTVEFTPITVPSCVFAQKLRCNSETTREKSQNVNRSLHAVYQNDLDWPKPRFQNHNIFLRRISWSLPTSAVSYMEPGIRFRIGYLVHLWHIRVARICQPSFLYVLLYYIGLVKNTFCTMRSLHIPIDSDSTVKEPHGMCHSITDFLVSL